MILSDNETSIDLLNNESIANTVVSLIQESDDRPLSFGIHGDWGAGKSSVLEMIQNKVDGLNQPNSDYYCCIRFNGWKHQGFEDSKIALMSSIVSDLSVIASEKAKGDETLLENIKKRIGKLWKNINWMTVAKTGAKVGVGLATGTTPIMLATSIPELIKDIGSSNDKMNQAISTAKSFFKNEAFTESSEDTSSNTEFKDFQNNFEMLLKEVGIKKLIVLIDDLDRCIPSVAIEILEAVKLFMFTSKTAFVIAADEGMIKYAVKSHFPDVIMGEDEENSSYGFADKYLEKIIQVPFRIPVLGSTESCIYIMLLMVGSKLSFYDEAFEHLRENAIERLQKPWSIQAYTASEISTLLGDTKYKEVTNEVRIATQIAHPLAENSNGNPRQIKRFINMLLLRYKISEARGYTDIRLDILAKVMLAEHFHNTFYRILPDHLDKNGHWNEVSDGITKENDKITEGKSDEKKNLTKQKRTSLKKESVGWYQQYDMQDWIDSEPSLNNVDLRPYYFICKENIDYLSGIGNDSDILEAVNILLQKSTVIASKIEFLRSLSPKQSEQVIDHVWDNIISSGDLKKKPDGFDGLRIFVKEHIECREKLVKLVSTLPAQEVGAWVTGGWDDIIPGSCPERKVLEEFFNRLKKDGSKAVKAAFNV